MPEPLEYEPLKPPRRRGATPFWLLYAIGGVCSAYTTDTVLHIGRRPSDGGCFLIGLYALVPFAVVILMTLFVIRRGRRTSPPAWSGALAGVLVPPITLGLLIATRII